MACKPCRNPALGPWWLWGLAGVGGALAVYLFTRKKKPSGITGPDLPQLPRESEDLGVQVPQVSDRRGTGQGQSAFSKMLERIAATGKEERDKKISDAREFFLRDNLQAEFAAALSPDEKSWIDTIYKTPLAARKEGFAGVDPRSGLQTAILVMSSEPGQWVEMFWPEVQTNTAPAIIQGLALALAVQARKAAELVPSSKAGKAGAADGHWNDWSDDKRLAVIRSMSV